MGAPLTVQELCDLSVEANLVPDAMFYAWDLFGGWQRRACDHFGGPRDKIILDVGCGPLRFGATVLQEIRDGHFYGVEPFGPYIEIGRRVAARLGAADKVTLIESDAFEFPPDIRVDFAMCHAVFTHVSREQIAACLERVAAVMRPGGAFVFTYNLAGTGRTVHRGRTYAEQMPMISVHLPDDSLFAGFAAARGLRFERLEAVPHPGQTCSVMRF